MKYFKVFIVSLLIGLALLGSAMYAYLNHLKSKLDIVEVTPHIDKPDELEDNKIPVDIANLTKLDELVGVSKRLNVLLLGIEGERADTIMLLSYEPEKKLLDIVTIPRDTYNEVAGHNKAGQHKINSVYGYGKVDGGSEGMRTQVSLLLKVPIRYYITLNYEGVSDIVDTIGGVQVSVKKHMKYDDPTAKPPLHIDIPKGTHILDGQRAIEYLRWRKNNGEEGSDLNRTERQVEFVKATIIQSLAKFKIVKVVNAAFNYIHTNMPLEEMLYYTTTLGGFDPKTNIKTYRIPGDVKFNKLSYYIHNVQKTEDMMISIYKRGYEPTKEKK